MQCLELNSDANIKTFLVTTIIFATYFQSFCVSTRVSYIKRLIMKGIELKKILRDNGISISQLARVLDISQQNLNSALSADDVKSGTIEKVAFASGKPVSFFYGESPGSVSASGDNSTAVAGNNNRVNTERFVNLLAKKDEQIDRLLSIIESLSNK